MATATAHKPASGKDDDCRTSSGTFPEVVARDYEDQKTVAVINEKQVAESTEKQVDGSSVLPEAIASGSEDKECTWRQEDCLSWEKPWNTKTWRERRKTRFCGLQFCWILIAVGALIVTGTVVGVALGTSLPRAGNPPKNKPSASSVIPFQDGITLYDASFIATPTATSPPTGTFVLPLGTPQATQASCLTQDDQKAAWSCNVASGNLEATLEVDTPIGSTVAGAVLSNNTIDNDALFYGFQPRSLSTTFSPFVLATNPEEPGSGAAFYFQTFYDKVIVVEGDAIDRGLYNKRAPQAAGEVTEGDKIWICYWNSTLLEGFIYSNEATSSAATTTDTTANNLSPYPSVITIREYRVQGSPSPYCIQYAVLATGEWDSIANAQGEQTRVDLSEEGLTLGEDISKSCMCGWLYG